MIAKLRVFVAIPLPPEGRAARDAMIGKGVEVTDIQTRNDGQRACYLEDPDGNRIELCTVSGFGVLV